MLSLKKHYDEEDLDVQLRAPRLLSICLLIIPVLALGGFLDFGLKSWLSFTFDLVGIAVAVIMVLLILTGRYRLAVPLMVAASLVIIMFVAFPWVHINNLTTRDVALYLSMPIIFTAIVERRPWVTLTVTGLVALYQVLVWVFWIQPRMPVGSFAPEEIFAMSLVLSLLGGLGIHQVLLITSKIAHKRELAIANSRQRQAELEARNADLEQLNRFFFHELKGPLITIQSFAGSLQLDLEKDRRDRAASDLRRILSASNFLNSAQARLAQLIRLGLEPCAVKEVDLTAIWNRVVLNVQGESGGAVFSGPEEPVKILAEASRLELILLELVKNSLQCFGPDPAGLKVHLRVAQTAGLIVLDFMDNGPGLAESRQEAAFEPFERYQGTGTGLGLTLARRAANNLGGSLKFLPVAQGCCLRLEMPSQKERPGIPSV